MDQTALVILNVFVYALASAPSSSQVGDRLEAGQPVPAEVRGLLVPEAAVVQLGAGSRLGWSDGDDRGLELEEGEVLVSAARPVVLLVSGHQVVVGPAAQALIRRSDQGVGVCSLSGVVRLEPAAGAEVVALAEGQCWGASDGQRVAARAEQLRRGAHPSPPAPQELPDLVGDPGAQFEELEAQFAAEVGRGPRREAQSCGCAEDGGSGGGLDPSGSSGPTPEPEQPEPGMIQVRIELPHR